MRPDAEHRALGQRTRQRKGPEQAASEFRQPDGRYRVAGDLLTSGDMIERLAGIRGRFPVHLIEDGLGEDDEAGWMP